ncbi:MAG: thioredoxin fold domain-containing protein [Bacteroidales bacterium]|jgi:thioredoxin|nr:thioredoxin fold domain-containing protein [Bacteroidales bacterium]
MKIFKYILILAAAALAVGDVSSHPETMNATDDSGEIVVLNKADFLTKIYNYEKHPQEWVYEGNLPCIIDFYADWCGPCKKVTPILKALAAEYKGKLIVYKIDVDREKELARFFGVSSIPMYLFIPEKDKPQQAIGAMPRESFEKVIKEFLLKDSGQSGL